MVQGTNLGNKGRHGIAGTHRPIAGESGLASSLLDSQLGALIVAEEFVRLLALATVCRNGGAMSPREMGGENSRSGRHGGHQDENRGDKAGNARVTAAPAAEMLDGGDGTCEDGAAVEESVEVVGQGAAVGVAALRLLSKALQADCFQVTRNLGLESRWRHWLLGADLLDRVRRRHSPEGRSAREQFVEDGAEGVLVDEWAGVMGLAAGLLRGHVVGRTDDCAGTRLVDVVAEAYGQAEVGDLGTAVGGKEDVRRLEVAVDDPLEMGGVDGAGDDADGPRGQHDVLRPADDVIGEAEAVDEFEGQVGQTTGLANVVDLDNVGVPEAGDGLGLRVESRQGDRAGVGTGQDHLKRHQTIQVHLAGLVNDAHSAPACLLEDLEAGDHWPPGSRVTS
jgi:hypothetical protein